MKGTYDNFISAFSSSVRFDILSLLAEQPLNLTRIAETLNINSTSVVSRHLARLGEQGLIQKENPSSRYYILTSFGQSVAEVLGPLGFLFKHQVYFRDHSLSDLPGYLLRDIDALNSATMVTGVGTVSIAVKRFVESIEKSAVAIVDTTFGNVNNKMQELKFIFPVSFYSDEI
ncbi:MAG: ArsR family transcriptional regulator [Candidatus Hodarchaeales archaeon]|jgi:predicted transcriptional regulator